MSHYWLLGFKDNCRKWIWRSLFICHWACFSLGVLQLSVIIFLTKQVLLAVDNRDNSRVSPTNCIDGALLERPRAWHSSVLPPCDMNVESVVSEEIHKGVRWGLCFLLPLLSILIPLSAHCVRNDKPKLWKFMRVGGIIVFFVSLISLNEYLLIYFGIERAFPVKANQ